MNWIRHKMSLRGLLQAMLALAVLVAPVTANAMERIVPSGSSHHQQAKAPAHCSEAPDTDSKHDKATDKTCCASMCMGVAVTPQAPTAGGAAVPAAATFSSPASLSGSPAELATPPPRLA